MSDQNPPSGSQMNTPARQLKPITPRKAQERFLEACSEHQKDTVSSYGDRLDHFVEWCEEIGIDNMNNLTGRLLDRFTIQRSKKCKKITFQKEVNTLKNFIDKCEDIEAKAPRQQDH